MTIKNVLDIAKKAHQGKRSALECEILLACLLEKDRIFLHLYDDFVINNDIFETLLEQVKLLNAHYPIEYITHKVNFYSEEFFIDENTLIPRPETEILIDKALDLIEKYKIKNIYEIGTGSGVISIMLCLLNKNINIIASDISQSALNVAKQNIKLKSNKDETLANRIRLICANLLGNTQLKNNALIISNPPYISKNYILPKNLTFEPEIALFGGDKGDEILKQIIQLDAKYLCCEIGYDQKDIKTHLKAYNKVEFYKDYADFYRGFVAIKA